MLGTKGVRQRSSFEKRKRKTHIIISFPTLGDLSASRRANASGGLNEEKNSINCRGFTVTDNGRKERGGGVEMLRKSACVRASDFITAILFSSEEKRRSGGR